MAAATKPRTEQGLWPTPEQTLLLQAALLDGEAARRAWHLWRESTEFEEVDYVGFGLLPLLYDNVRRLGIEDPILARLKGAYRMAWVTNAQLFDTVRPVLTEFREQGIETVLLKGAPVAAVYYRSPALRPMSDIDALVRPSDARRAFEVLASAGWMAPRAGPVDDDEIRFRHGRQYRDGNGNEFDLHWKVMIETVHRNIDAGFWESIIPFDFIDGVRAHRLDATHSLLHTLAHGNRWSEVPPIRWIPDAKMILRVDGHLIDWDRVLHFAREARIAGRMLRGLHYLSETFEAPVPAHVIESLRDTKVSWLEKLEDTSTGLEGKRGRAVTALANFCRRADGGSDLPAYLRFKYSTVVKR